MGDSPNILLILTDQHRLSAVGAYGDTVCQTPHIDRLATEGTRFENAYTTCPVCSPARASIMTGQYPHAHGITANLYELGSAVHELHDRPELLSRRLEAAGYQLGYTGKWHLGTDLTQSFGIPNSPSLPCKVGFEGQNFPGHGGGGFVYEAYTQYLKEHGWRHELKPWREARAPLGNMGELAGPIESSVPYFLTEHTIGLIDRFADRGAPFFIWHNFWGPHEPYYAPTAFVDIYRDVEIPPWPNYDWPSRATPGPHHVKIHPDHERLIWDDWATALRHYYAFASLIDSQIGRLMQHLRQSGLIDNTVVIFAADHGETLGSHGGLTDKGWHHFEETHRIPFVVRLPDGVEAGQVRRELVSLASMYPTVLDLAGAEFDAANIHGRSLLPLIRDTADGWPQSVVTEFGGVNGSATTQRSLRHGHLKYGYNCSNRDELYDLAADPFETRNLIDDPGYRDAVRDLRSRLADWMRQTDDHALILFDLALRYERGRT